MKISNRPNLEKRGPLVINKDREGKRQYKIHKHRAARLEKLESDVEELRALVEQINKRTNFGET